MERKTTTTGQFEEAIKNFSKISLEVDSLINAGNADAHKLKNKSIEHRNEAISHEVAKRMKSFEVEQKGKASKESIQRHDKLKEIFLEKVKQEFDEGVEEQKTLLRGSVADENKEVDNKKSESASDEESENESDEDTDEEGSESDTTDDDSSDDEAEDEDSDDEKTNEVKSGEDDTNKK